METICRNELDTLREGETVFLTTWKNRKDGTRLFKINEACIIARHDPNERKISFKKSLLGKKTLNKDDYGITWKVQRCQMS